MNKTKNRSNSKNLSFNTENSNKKIKSSNNIKSRKNLVPKIGKPNGRTGKDLISPKTIDYSKSLNYF